MEDINIATKNNVTAEKFRILLVDDNIEILKLASNILENANYHVYFATSGLQALQMLEQNVAVFDFILLDIMMPDLSGFETCMRIKSNPKTRDIPVMFVTAKTDGQTIGEAYALGGIDYICKPFFANELLMKLKTHLSLTQAKKLLKAHNLDLEKKLDASEAKYSAEVENNRRELVRLMNGVIDVIENNGHNDSYKITNMAVLFAKLHPSLTEEDEDTLRQAVPLHDMGKLTKLVKTISQGELDYLERKYPLIGYELLKNSELEVFRVGANIAKQHRENWDGSGFPYGTVGKDIHIYARIVNLCLSIYEMYYGVGNRRKIRFEAVVERVKKLQGFKYDPRLVMLFLENAFEFEEILKK